MEWKTVKLGDVCDLIAGFAFKAGDFGDYPQKVVKIGDINPPHVTYASMSGIDLSKYDVKKLEKFKVQYGDYVLAMTGATIGKVGKYIDSAFSYLNQRVLMFKPKPEVDAQFVNYVVCSAYFRQYVMNHIDSESAQPNISATTIGKYEFLLPSLDEQHRIATILSSLDDKIENNNRINRNLEAQAQALFKSWFVDFEPFGGTMPEDWREGLFVDLINIMPGGTPSTNVETYWKGGTIPFFSPKDVKGVYCFDTEKHITELGLNNCSSRLYEKDTLFITARGTVGKLALAGVPMAMNQSNYALVAKSGVGCHFLFLLAQTIIDILLKKANGAVFSAITARDFKEPVIIPTTSTMMKFENIVSPLFEKIYQNCEESQRLAALRDTLLPKLMRGEIAL